MIPEWKHHILPGKRHMLMMMMIWMWWWWWWRVQHVHEPRVLLLLLCRHLHHLELHCLHVMHMIKSLPLQSCLLHAAALSTTLHCHVAAAALSANLHRGHSMIRRSWHHLSSLHLALALHSLLLDILHPEMDLLQVLVNDPAEIIQVRQCQSLEGLPSQALEHDASHLLLAVVFLLLLELFLSLGDPLPQETLLIHHLLALLHFGHGLELREHALDSQRGRPDFRLGVIGAVDNSTSINVTKGGEFTHLLHETLLPFLECRFSSTVIGYVGKFHLLSSHS